MMLMAIVFVIESLFFTVTSSTDIIVLIGITTLLFFVGFSAVRGWLYSLWDSIIGFTVPPVKEPTDYFYSSRYAWILLNFPLTFLSFLFIFTFAMLFSESGLWRDSPEGVRNTIVGFNTFLNLLILISEVLVMMQRSADGMGELRVDLPSRWRYSIYGHPIMFYGMGLMAVGVIFLLLGWFLHLLSAWGYFIGLGILFLGGLFIMAGVRYSA